MNSVIITDDFKLSLFPPNCKLTTRTIAPEAVKILFNASSKDQVQFRHADNANQFIKQCGEEFTNANYPRKFVKGDVVVHCSYFKPKPENSTEGEPDFLLYRLIGIN